MLFRYRFLILLLPLICLTCLAGANPAKEKIVIWHTFDVLPAAVLSEQIKEFAVPRGVDVRLETGMDVVQSLMDVTDSDLAVDIPDAVIGPSDIIGHAGSIGLIPIEKLTNRIYAKGVLNLTRMNGTDWGYPLVWGNHLFLHFDKSVAPLTDLDKTKKSPENTLALQTGEPYVFLVLVLGQLDPSVKEISGERITAPILVKALQDYKALTASYLLVKDCDYHCISRDFYQGKWKQAINGDWALTEAEKILGDKLRLAPLPGYNGVKWRSPCATFALMMTRAVKNHPTKKAFLKDLAAFLTSENAQMSWFRKARRIPVNDSVLTTLGKSAVGNDKVILEELSRAVCILPDQSISAMWPAMRKGLRLFMSGVRTAEDTAAYILQLSK